MLRARFFRIVERVAESEDGRQILIDALRAPRADGTLAALAPLLGSSPYADLGTPATEPARRAPVFITARFRSGSTLLWNLFRHIPECTAFYEPLNERRWFDASTRGTRVDNTHAGIDDYWREYDGLAHLARWYREEWINRHLYMGPDFWEPRLFEYITALVDAAPRRAVLQFNRVDFRLPWLKHYFPSALMVHLYRHPREQWRSTLMDSNFPLTGTVSEFEPHDHYYLLAWARDLSLHFPFLDPRVRRHPYELFYLIWKLSWLFGTRYCNASFCYETLCANPGRELRRLLEATAISSCSAADLVPLVKAAPEPRAHRYAPREWFEEQEARAETTLQRALGRGRPAHVDAGGEPLVSADRPVS